MTSINIATPTSGSTVNGTITLTGTQGGATVTASTGASQVVQQPNPFSFSIDTTTFPNGPQTFSVSDGTTSASVSVNVSNVVVVVPPTTTFTVDPITANTATFLLTGVAGTNWVNVAVWDNATGTKVGSDATPAAGTGVFASSVNLGTLTGARTLNVMAFSVAAGQSGGTSTTVSVSYTVAVIAPPPASLGFYGVGSHYVQNGIYTQRSFANMIADVQAAGCETVREDAYTLANLTTQVNTVIPGWSPLKVISCFIPNITGTPAQAYASNYTLGQQAAGIIAGHVPVLEFGNEWNLICINNVNTTDGNLPNQFNQTSTTMYMAAMAGFTQGFRNVDTTKQTKLALNGTYLHFGWLKMIETNTLPNGAASGYTMAHDLITWHHYSTGGNPAQVNGLSGTYNVLNSIEALTTKQYYFSETGGGAPNITNSVCQAWIGTAYSLFASHPQCIGANWYELYDFTDGAYGLYSVNGSNTTAKPQVATMAAFVAAHPK